MNPDVYFQCKEGANVKAASLPDTVQHYMDEINKLTGRDYKLFNYYGAPDAEEVIVMMCSASRGREGNRGLPEQARAARWAWCRSTCTGPSL